jgi:hypothetical protein
LIPQLSASASLPSGDASPWRLADFLRRRYSAANDRRLSLASEVIVLALSASLLLVYAADFGGFEVGRVTLGCIICALSCLPLILYLRSADRPPLPLLPLTGLFYFASCGLPAFYDFSSSGLRDVWHIEPSMESLTIVISGLLALYIGYYVSSGTRLLRKVQPIVLPRAFPLRRMTNLLWTLLTLHLAALIFRDQVIALHLDQVFLPLGYLPYGMFLILWLRRLLGPVQKGALLAFTVMEASIRFASGSVAILYLFVLFLLIVVWIERQRLSMILVSAGLVLFALVNYAKVEYRALTWGDGLYANAGITEKALLFGEITVRPFTGAGMESSYPAVDALISRVSVLAFLTHVINQTPDTVPYWKGETYAALLYKLIPRAMWEDKPSEVLGYEFSSRYGLRAALDDSTSFNVPWIVEMYANFGAIGVMAGMAMVGFLFAWLERKLNSRSMTTLELMLGATVLFDLFYQESNFSLMIGSKILFAPLLYWVIRATLSERRAVTGRFRWRERARAAASH